MRRLLRWAGWVAAGFALCVIVGVAAFDVLVVLPAVSKMEAFIASAAPAERQPPRSLVSLLNRAFHSRLAYAMASDALYAAPSQVEGMRQLRRQLTEEGVGLLLPLHLSQSEIEVAYLAHAYMGPDVRGFDVRGFASASSKYLNTALENVDAYQAAKLVVISRGPNYYLKRPESLEDMTRRLMSAHSSSE